MDAYVFRAELHCSDCADRIKLYRPDCDQGDSDEFPQGPYCDGGGEADTPQHCAGCGAFLENPLTDDGRDYVRDALDNYHPNRITTLWAGFYGIEPPRPDCEEA